MDDFTKKLLKHAEHIKLVCNHCTTEETTKQALILPLLEILGFNPYDPTKVKAEYKSDFPGAKANERVDYALFCNNEPVLFVEAKPFGENIENHQPQLSRYFNATPEVIVAAITNGNEWRFFTDLNFKHVMDSDPFLVVNFSELDQSQISRLYHFRHDEFQASSLRTLAEESIYLNTFTNEIRKCLQETDIDFVRYIASRGNIQKQLNGRFLEILYPIVQQAIGRAIGDMLTTRFPPKVETEPSKPVPIKEIDKYADYIDPDNPKIVTTYSERRLFEVAKSLLADGAEDIVARDTESYYTILYQGKTNRWLLRYMGDRREPVVTFQIPMTKERRHEIERAGLEFGSGDSVKIPQPEYLMRIPGILNDALQYCIEPPRVWRRVFCLS